MHGRVSAGVLGADQLHCSNHNQQNNGEHHRVLGDVLGLCTSPNGAEALSESVHLTGAGEAIEVALKAIYSVDARSAMARKCYVVSGLNGRDWLTAKSASSRRVETPVLSKILLKWCFTVSSLILKCSAISLLA